MVDFSLYWTIRDVSMDISIGEVRNADRDESIISPICVWHSVRLKHLASTPQNLASGSRVFCVDNAFTAHICAGVVRHCERWHKQVASDTLLKTYIGSGA